MRPSRLLVVLLVAAVAVVPVFSHVVLAAPTALAADAGREDAVDGSARLTVLDAGNTTDYLGFETDEVEREDHARTSLDVVGAVEQGAAAIDGEYRSLSFEYAYANASEGNGSEVVFAEIARVERRVDALVARHDRAIQRFNERDWAAARLLRELAAIDARARSLDGRLGRLDEGIESGDAADADERIDSLRADLIPLAGPVTRRIGAAVAGERAPFVAYTITSANGVVTATTAEGTFYRDAYLGEATGGNGSNHFVGDGDPTGVSTALSRAQSLYPWAAANGLPSADSATPPIYPVTLEHDHGVLDAFLDGRTEAVFREYQSKQLDRLPVETRTSSGDGIRVRVNATHGTGPLSITVTDADSGNPIDANVTVDGNRVGTTGADGQLWTVSSYGSIRLLIESPDGRSLQRNYVID